MIERLKAAMDLRRCPQSELADLLTVDRGNFNRIYNQRPKAPEFTATQISTICAHLKISSDWLLGLADYELSQERHEWFKAYKKLPRGIQVGVIQATAITMAECLEDVKHQYDTTSVVDKKLILRSRK